MYLYADCDTSPSLAGRRIQGKDLAAIVDKAKRLLGDVSEGQIGLYENALGHGFKGYVIKYPGQEPYFEEASAE